MIHVNIGKYGDGLGSDIAFGIGGGGGDDVFAICIDR
jgi:hypothetical protein